MKLEDKFYLSQEYFERFIKSLDSEYQNENGYVYNPKQKQERKWEHKQGNWVYDTNSCVTLDATMYKHSQIN